MYVRGPAGPGGRPVRTGPAAQPPGGLPLGGGGSPREGWLSLGEVAEREIALGAVGRFWQPDIQWHDVAGMTAGTFAAFTEPGWGRIQDESQRTSLCCVHTVANAGVERGAHRDRASPATVR